MIELKGVLKLTLLEKKDVLIAIFFGFLAGVASVALMGSSGYLISKAALTSQMTTLVVMAACLKLFGFASALSRYAERLYSHRATFTMLSHLRVSFFERLSPLAPGIFSKYRSGDLLSRIVGDVESLQNFLLRVFYPPVVLGIVFLSAVFFTSFFSLGIAIVIFIGMLLTVVVVPALFSSRKRRMDGQVRAQRGNLAIESTEFLYGFRDLKIHQQLNAKEQQLKNDAAQYNEGQRQEGLEENLAQSMNAFVALLVSFFVLGVGAYFVAAGELNGLYLAMLVMISIAAFENVAPMAAFPTYFEESRKASVRLEEIVAEPAALQGTEGMPNGPLDIRLDKASFQYPGDSSLAVNCVSLHLKPGTKTAIVGPSGSGKSTLMQLLLTVFPLNQGQLSIGGKSVEALKQEEIWQQMNIVLQENHFFYGTIRSNLLMANSEVTEEQMIRVLAQVQLNNFSLNMTVEEKGQNLSGGQKQRLAIARAMLRGKPLWLLDEPVSSVDSLTAQVIYQQMFQQHKDDLFVIISHDLTGLENMDQIVVMEKGCIVESGSYDELMEKKAYFYQLKEIENSVFA
ncbi:cysteine ABC transporter permease/ATP-binding protein [Planococcus donghaensis MPA1U2]|uniref:Cysteine ABC transporter permease/ATP-binding protein n=1 Tax=Planococcus donghaensis MPA1U2 TaxID=933115 RepID=E7RCT2_9BACL|nr:thiol reductant ABC exporter subunit CydC [Planococcus donghaensis]EGA91146.1 cysteine ABC transporter permease/ATP-binding protein [Planococcus donghaensis MPA1U2]